MSGSSDTCGLFYKLCNIPCRLENKLAIVTGANCGIGLHTAAELARHGARVIMACRNVTKAEQAKQEILRKYGKENPKWMELDVASDRTKAALSPIEENQLIIEQLDLTSTDSINQFSKKIIENFPELHYLVNNAGLVCPKFDKNNDGIELTMATNHVGTFLLTRLLLPLLKKTADITKQTKPGEVRIINVSSMAHSVVSVQKDEMFMNENNFNIMKSYCYSKLANAMHSAELSRRLADTGIIVASLHPGVVNTNFGRDLDNWYQKLFSQIIKQFSISSWKGCQTTLHTLFSENIISGAYYSNCQLNKTADRIASKEDCLWLWNKTKELLHIEESSD